MHAKFEHDKKKTTVTDTHQPMLEEDTSSDRVPPTKSILMETRKKDGKNFFANKFC